MKIRHSNVIVSHKLQSRNDLELLTDMYHRKNYLVSLFHIFTVLSIGIKIYIFSLPFLCIGRQSIFKYVFTVFHNERKNNIHN